MAVLRKDDTYFFGELVTDDSLVETEKEKKRDYTESSVKRSEQESYFKDGWTFHKEIKDRVIIRKKKDDDEAFEDSVWLLFKGMGFQEMNRDRNFKIQTNVSPKQIDVFAKDDNNVFVIECKTGTPSLIKDIQEILFRRKDIKNSIEKHYGKKFRVSFILITKNIDWGETEEKLAKENEKNCFFHWKEEDLDAYKMLADQLGHASKYQVYGMLFGEREASEVGEIKVPAMYGGKKNKYYLFLIQPEKLFKIAYVHRREKSSPKDIRNAYQRMISKQRIEEIGKFIDNGNSFPNNIIINFNKKPIFEPSPKIKEVSGISYGILKFPPYYGCAWIIDGQHRLYGYSKSQHAADPKHTIPVIAFETLDVKDQANLFVDINQEQKSVNQNLLWDLYSDIYEGSTEKKQQILRSISLISKKLNDDEDSVFHNHVQIPSIMVKSKDEANLTLTNVCDAIKENRLIDENEKLLFKENYETTINFSTEVIKSYFELIVSSLKLDWERGEKGLLRTNVGLRIMFIVLRELLIQLYHDGKENVYRKSNLNDFKEETKNYLLPLIEKLNKFDEQKITEIREGSTKGLVMKNVQKLLWEMKESTGFGLELWNNKNAWNPGIPESETEDKILLLIDDTEIKLRNVIMDTLKQKYQQNWWKQGIPEHVKDEINRNMDQDASKFPWKRQEMEALSYEEKLVYCLTSNLKDIIINGNNWGLFEQIFYKYKDCVAVQLGFFENFRNKYKHPERKLSLDEVEKGLGYYGMGWIRKCIGLNPKKIN